MPSINIDLDFFDHRKTKRFVILLGPGAELYLIKLWAYCGKYHAQDGRFSDESDAEIEGFSGWKGIPGGMLQGMLTAGFLEKEPDGCYVVHDWLDHEGHIQRYALKSKQMNAARWDNDSPARNPARNPKAGQGRALQGNTTSRSLTGGNGSLILESEVQAGPESYAKRHPQRIFTDGWDERFNRNFGAPYNAIKADFVQIASLVKKFEVSDLLHVVELAWSKKNPRSHWNCVNKSHTIRDFCSKYNDIVVELNKPESGL